MSVEIDLRGLKKFYRHSKRDVAFLLKVDWGHLAVDRELLADWASFVHVSSDGAGEVRAEQWLNTTAGWSGTLTNVAHLDDALTWLTDFGNRIGASGTITGGPKSRGPHLGESMLAQPTAFLAYTTGDLNTVASDYRAPLWFVDPTTTRYIVEKIQSWAYTPGCRQYLTRAAVWTTELVGTDWEDGVAEATTHE